MHASDFISMRMLLYSCWFEQRDKTTTGTAEATAMTMKKVIRSMEMLTQTCMWKSWL